MAKQLINPVNLYDGTAFGMSQAVVDTHSKLMFISGQVAWDQHFQVSSPSVDGQLKQALDNLDQVLATAHLSVGNLLHLKVYLRGELAEHMEVVGPILANYLGSSRPSLTGIGVASLASPETLVEVEAIASTQ